MKSSLNKIVIAASFILLALTGTVKAEGKEITFKKVNTTVNVKEQVLEIENWMVDEEKWDLNTNKKSSILIEPERDLEIADWMLNAQNWKNNQTIDINNEKDAPLTIESWMIETKK